MAKSLRGRHLLPFYLGDWYWIPSRAIPAQGDTEPITEFPFFTVLYADLHAHLFALPVTLLALGWVISVVKGRARWRGLVGGVLGFVIGGMALGALYPINLSDIYAYLPLAMVALGYAIWRYASLGFFRRLQVSETSKRVVLVGLGVIALAALAFLLFYPYRAWYSQGYSSVQAWNGPRTPISSYITHWGLFLFILVSWMIWETLDWMAKTPYSSLRKLRPHLWLILTTPVALLGLMTLMQVWVMKMRPIPQQNWSGALVVWLALPLAAWAGVLMLRPGRDDSHKLVLFMVGTALLITVMVELVVVKGDIGRMNTVFKFYLQVWTLLAVSSAAVLGWLIEAMPAWKPRWRLAWEVPFTLLVFSAALFTLLWYHGEDQRPLCDDCAALPGRHGLYAVCPVRQYWVPRST